MSIRKAHETMKLTWPSESSNVQCTNGAIEVNHGHGKVMMSKEVQERLAI